MNFLFLVFTFLAAIASSKPQQVGTETGKEEDWLEFKVKYEKNYLGEENDYHKKIFFLNKQRIAKHNAEVAAGKRKNNRVITRYSDLTKPIEARISNPGSPAVSFVENYLELLLEAENAVVLTDAVGKMELKPEENMKLPDYFDWRDAGLDLVVKKQGYVPDGCRASYAFAVVSALEAQSILQFDKDPELSVQQIINCTKDYGNRGCQGGRNDRTYQYIYEHGIGYEQRYPYLNRNGLVHLEGACIYDPNDAIVKIDGFVVAFRAKEEILRRLIYVHGPITAVMHGEGLLEYTEGVYQRDNCTNIDHEVLLVGWGHEKGTDFWIAMNSYGRDWGQEGYFLIKRGVNMCQIETVSTVPIISSSV